jgi:arylsulfatase A-like enzyme
MKRHPNILFILADDLGYGDLGLLGNEKIRTPPKTIGCCDRKSFRRRRPDSED